MPNITSIDHITPTAPVAHRLCASVILSRPPQITRDLHPFEKAFYLYQRRLNERTALPFTRFFYFNEKTPAIIDFRRKLKERKTPARDIGLYDAWGREGWNDEVLVGAPESELEHQLEGILKDDIVEENDSTRVLGESGAPSATSRPMPRDTEADRTGDEKSLDRKLQRTLYLLVKSSEDDWRFPTDSLAWKESLRVVSFSVLESNMVAQTYFNVGSG
jgi:large subunit ribosomal protein L46